MIATAHHADRETPHLRVVEARDPKEVVAVILADGSVRDLRASTAEGGGRRRISVGSVSGPDWIVWWQRRGFAEGDAG
jgi:hypothetical protein